MPVFRGEKREVVTKKREVAKHDKSFATSFFIHTFVLIKQKAYQNKISRMKYPIGIQSFESLINDRYIYVDKTALIYQLAHTL